jgi:hypothetical protein
MRSSLAAKCGAILKLGMVASSALAQQQTAQQNPVTEQGVAQARYQACLSTADAARDAAWAVQCKELSAQAEKNHADCTANAKLPPSYCDSSYPAGNAAPDCVLPPGAAAEINAELAMARNRCLQDSKAVLQ